MNNHLKKLELVLFGLDKLKNASKVRVLRKEALMGPTTQTLKRYEQTTKPGREVLHTVLDLIGIIPVVGEGADILNAALYLSEGITQKNLLLAGLSIISVVPGLGDVAKIVKYGSALAPGTIKIIAKLVLDNQGKITLLSTPRILAIFIFISSGASSFP